MNRREFPGGQELEFVLSREDMGSIPDEELRSLKLCGTAKKKGMNRNERCDVEWCVRDKRKKGSSDGRIREK